MTSTSAPSRRPSRSTLTIRATTRSPCISERIWRGREEQVDAPVVGPDESEAVPVPDDATGDQVHPIDEPELTAAISDDLAIAHHGAQPPLQGLPLGRGTEARALRQSEGIRQVRQSAREIRSGHCVQGRFATRARTPRARSRGEDLGGSLTKDRER